MPIALTGALKFSDIQTEFGGTNPISMSEYYKDAATGYASSVSDMSVIGTPIGFGKFRGKTKFIDIDYVFTQTTIIFTIPTGCTKICVLCIGGGGSNFYNWGGSGGGGLAWANFNSVSANETYTVNAGDKDTASYFQNTGASVHTKLQANAGSIPGTQNNGDGMYGGAGGTYSFTNTNSKISISGGGNGGTGGNFASGNDWGGGGGAGGYDNNGGNGGRTSINGAAGSGGGGGGGGGNRYEKFGCGGGGVGIYGKGSDGSANGGGGSGGGNGGGNNANGGGGLYGGGSGGSGGNNANGNIGVVRIMCTSQSSTRSFPSTASKAATEIFNNNPAPVINSIGNVQILNTAVAVSATITVSTYITNMNGTSVSYSILSFSTTYFSSVTISATGVLSYTTKTSLTGTSTVIINVKNNLNSNVDVPIVFVFS